MPAALALAAFTASWSDLGAVFGLSLLLSVVAGAIFSMFFSRITSRRIHQLTEAARRLTGDRRARPIPITGNGRDEVDQLAIAFNEMHASLAENIRAIDEERSRLAAVLSHMADGVVIIGADGQVLSINRAAGRLLQIAESRAVGVSASLVLRDHELVAMVRQALSGHRGDIGPRQVTLGRTGRPRAVQALVSTVPGDLAQGRRVLLILQDVTLLRQAETVRRDFVANVSHELRTPVAVLKALVETLEDGALDDPEAASEFLGRMHVEVDGLAQLIEELLELSRIESGQLALQRRPVDLGAVARAAAERLRPQAERQGVALIASATEGLPLVAVDPDRIQQVVVNLVHNAVKFTPPGGRVVLTVERGDGAVAVSVADTGAGIAPEALARLFERFFKADRARSGGGTGLGLSIAKHIVQAHGGEIWAESPGEGGGATFSFTIPVTAEIGAAAGEG